MKKSILVVLMVAFLTTPCLAQEIKSDGLFSIEGTRWACRGVAVVFLFMEPFIMPIDDTVYFTERSVQTTSGNIGILDDVDTYLDFLVFSVAWGRISGWEQDWFTHYEVKGIMLLQPAIGLGTFSSIIRSHSSSPLSLIVGVAFGHMIEQ